jgi:two-component system OmpR family sensor kinase/two-component system sensor histidine kinase QseC
VNSVRRRLLFALLALVVAVDGLAGLLSYQRALQSTGSLFDYQLRQMALSLREQGPAVDELRIGAPDPDFDFMVEIWSQNGAPIYRSRDEPLAGSAPLGFNDLSIDNQSWRAFALQTGQRVILVAQPWAARKAMAGRAALGTIAPLLLLTPLLGLATWWIVVRALRPIKDVAAEVQARDAGSLAPLAARDLPQEIAPLVGALNHLLERLSGAFKAQRAFIADAAHELRSPLTALRVQLQLLGRAGDEAGRSQAVERLGAAIERANLLVQQLLTLARNEPGMAAAAFVPLKLEPLVREAAADCAGLALARNTELSLDAEGGDEIEGDADSLRTLARNLIENAVRYTPAGGRVRVRIRGAGGRLKLEVADSGPGIHADERARVFDRFYRGEVQGESGSGLGLAIVKAVAERHGARLDLGEADLGGLQVTVSLPARAASALKQET